MVQINQNEDAWLMSFNLKKREQDLKRTVLSGEGIINDRINYLLKTGKTYTSN